MSHFSVMVAMSTMLEQDAVEGYLNMALAPYNENVATDVEWIDFDEEMIEKVKVRAGRADERADLEIVSSVAYDSGIRWYEDTWQYASYYNPKAKWDWWQWGGRWAGFIPVKADAPHLHGERSWTNEKSELPPGRADACMIKDVDFEGEWMQARLAAEDMFERANRAVEGMQPCEPWASRYERLKGDDLAIDLERLNYASEPYYKALKETNIFSYSTDPVQVMLSRPTVDHWISHQMSLVMSTFAYLTLHREWVEQGEMGWFGFSHDNFTPEEWMRIQREWRDSLPPETVVAVVDCHI